MFIFVTNTDFYMIFLKEKLPDILFLFLKRSFYFVKEGKNT
jgi:hypothetical protein